MTWRCFVVGERNVVVDFGPVVFGGGLPRPEQFVLPRPASPRHGDTTGP